MEIPRMDSEADKMVDALVHTQTLEEHHEVAVKYLQDAYAKGYRDRKEDFFAAILDSVWKGREKYRPTTKEQALAYLVEECGEVLAAAGKSQRFGLENVNPDLTTAKQETNRDWLLREIGDLERAIRTAIFLLTGSAR